jgi:hypothetical protein
MPRFTPLRLVGGCFLGIMLCLFGWWGLDALYAQPQVYVPVPGAYTQPIRKTCGSGGCYYLASYQSPSSEQAVAVAFQHNGWDCKHVLSDSDLDRDPLLTPPYWRCIGKAFPTGRAFISIESINQTETRLHITVYWS